MPELPEVETTVNKLKPLLKGRRILDLGNKKILGVERRGKAILIWLEGGGAGQKILSRVGAPEERVKREKFTDPRHLLAFHQRMSGKLLIVDRAHKDKYIRRRFQLSDAKDLAFHDVRRFGVVWYGKANKVLQDNYFKTLGIDALTASLQSIKNILLNKKTGKIKSFLLDQKNLAGIGNIMADEILWDAKIHPERKISTLADFEIKKIWSSLRAVLKKSIKLGGSSMRDWFHPGGEKGGYFEKRMIYGREGELCRNCKSKILRKKIAGRSSYYCLKCQN